MMSRRGSEIVQGDMIDWFIEDIVQNRFARMMFWAYPCVHITPGDFSRSSTFL